MVDGKEATDHEAQTSFRKKTPPRQNRPAFARSRTRQISSIKQSYLSGCAARRAVALPEVSPRIHQGRDGDSRYILIGRWRVAAIAGQCGGDAGAGDLERRDQH